MFIQPLVKGKGKCDELSSESPEPPEHEHSGAEHEPAKPAQSEHEHSDKLDPMRNPGHELEAETSSIQSVGNALEKPSSSYLATKSDAHDLDTRDAGIVEEEAKKKARSVIGVGTHNKFAAHFADSPRNV